VHRPWENLDLGVEKQYAVDIWIFYRKTVNHPTELFLKIIASKVLNNFATLLNCGNILKI